MSVSDSVCTRAPSVEQIAEVCTIDITIAINVSTWQGGVHRSPEREQRAEVCAVDLAVDEQVRKALAIVGNGVAIEVRCAGCKFTHVAYAVVVAVGLHWIRDGWAVV